MEIITIKKKALVLDEDEIAKLKECMRIYSGAIYTDACPELHKFAKYMIVKLEELEM